MKPSLLAVVLALVNYMPVAAQKRQAAVPVIVPSACVVTIDSSFHTRCGYLVVPENRKKTNGKTIQLPFILVESKDPAKKKDPLLYTAGGPGGSSLNWASGATKHSIIDTRDCIAFEQRGTHFARPSLWNTELSDAIKDSYRKNLNKDSMVLVGVRRYKKALERQGIDLAGYNSDESVADIEDLLTALQLDSVNLVGGSYSGGLMMAVLQQDPKRVRSLILDSPLPMFGRIDEDEPAHFNEALAHLFEQVKKDSTDTVRYANLKERFEEYFTSIGGQKFSVRYAEKGSTDTMSIEYDRNDLLNILNNDFDVSRIRSLPYVITEMINGHHDDYMTRHLDGIFQHDIGPSGMRISVYCADQEGFSDQAVIDELYRTYPWMAGYHINDVYKAICDCWQVPPIKATTKQPFYSNKPALLADGIMDNACAPLYIDMIHHYMPNSQRLLFLNRSHMVGGPDMGRMMQLFLDNPYQKLPADNAAIVVY
jgi:pimeloyl-ACP methyl ester carboxylesterase